MQQAKFIGLVIIELKGFIVELLNQLVFNLIYLVDYAILMKKISRFNFHHILNM